MPAVSTKVLKWARNASGLSVEEVVSKLGWKSNEKFESIEAGELEPTRVILNKLAEIYRKPLIAFYMDEPPKASKMALDFRTLPDPDRRTEQILQTLVRDVQARQDIVRAALEEADEAVILKFPGSIKLGMKSDLVAKAIAKEIGFSGQDFANCADVNEAFAKLRTAIEKSGVFVLIESNLGSHHTNIGAGVFRGFALSDPSAPFIVINAKDTKAAWAFTLMHELTHVWMGQSALSGYDSTIAIEKFCDEVAAAYLLDRMYLANAVLDRARGINSLATSVSEIANRRNLSRRMISYNLMTIGRISSAEYISLTSLFAAQRLQANPDQEAESGGPSYFVLRRHRLGAQLVSTVNRFVSEGYLTTTKAARVLGVKPTAVFKTLETKRAA